MADIKVITMTNYNFVNEVATFSFIKKSGAQTNITVHKDTFIKLMDGTFDNDSSPEKASDLQNEFKRTVMSEVKGNNYVKWFENEADRVTRNFLDGK